LADVDDSTIVLEDVDFLDTVEGVHGHLLQDAAQLLVVYIAITFTGAQI
jgi:hypothetical protein